MSRTAVASLLILSVCLGIGCFPDSAPSPTTDLPPATPPTTTTTTVATTTTLGPPAEGTLNVGRAVPLETLDPADAVALPEWEVILSYSEGLLVQDPDDGEVTPGLAAELPAVSDDGLTYTFGMDPDATFSDGTPLTAEVYVESLRRTMAVGGRASDLVNNYVQEIEAPDEGTVVIMLREPVAFFPVLLSGPAYVAVHPESFPPDQLLGLPETPLHGSGEWYVAGLSEERVTLRQNPYVASDATLEEVVIHHFASSEELVAAMENGDLDVAWQGLGPDAEAVLGSMDGVTVAQSPGGVLESLVLNHQREPTDDPLVRRAVSAVVDRAAVAEELLDGAVEPAFSPVPPGIPGSTGAFSEEYGEPNTEMAIELLTEAGYTAEEPASIELAYPPERYGLYVSRAMEELERQFEATGLIDVTLTAQAWNTYVGEVVDGAYNAALLGWLFDFPDPHNYLAPFLLQGGLGGSGSGGTEEVDEMVALLEEAAVETEAGAREALYRQLQEIYAREVVTLPLWIDPEAVAYRDHVRADSDGSNPEALNIGPTLRLDYSSLQVDR